MRININRTKYIPVPDGKPDPVQAFRPLASETCRHRHHRSRGTGDVIGWRVLRDCLTIGRRRLIGVGGYGFHA